MLVEKSRRETKFWRKDDEFTLGQWQINNYKCLPIEVNAGNMNLTIIHLQIHTGIKTDGKNSRQKKKEDQRERKGWQHQNQSIYIKKKTAKLFPWNENITLKILEILISGSYQEDQLQTNTNTEEWQVTNISKF